jgi:hypothetical protein
MVDPYLADGEWKAIEVSRKGREVVSGQIVDIPRMNAERGDDPRTPLRKGRHTGPIARVSSIDNRPLHTDPLALCDHLIYD